MSIRQIATATALLALVAAATPAFAQSQPADQPQASQDQAQPADQQNQEKKQ